MLLRLIFCCLFAVLLAGVAQAVLPPDAGFRPQQIRADYMRREQAHQERQKQQAAFAIEQYKKAEAAINTPPWLRAGSGIEAQTVVKPSAAAETKASKRNHRLLVSFVFLIFISAAAGWVWYKTREVDQ